MFDLPEGRMRAMAHTPALLSDRDGGWAGVPIVAALLGAYPQLSPSGSERRHIPHSDRPTKSA